MSKDNKQYLYNIGARKYVALNDEGSLVLTETPVPMDMSNGEKGILLGNYQQKQWIFVLNQNVEPDKNATVLKTVETDDNRMTDIYSLSGNRIAQPNHRLNIIKKNDGTMKKVLMK